MTGRTCRVCGCTDDRACLVLVDGGGIFDDEYVPCSWAEPDVCSGCVDGVASIPHHALVTTGGGVSMTALLEAINAEAEQLDDAIAHALTALEDLQSKREIVADMHRNAIRLLGVEYEQAKRDEAAAADAAEEQAPATQESKKPKPPVGGQKKGKGIGRPADRAKRTREQAMAIAQENGTIIARDLWEKGLCSRSAADGALARLVADGLLEVESAPRGPHPAVYRPRGGRSEAPASSGAAERPSAQASSPSDEPPTTSTTSLDDAARHSIVPPARPPARRREPPKRKALSVDEQKELERVDATAPAMSSRVRRLEDEPPKPPTDTRPVSVQLVELLGGDTPYTLQEAADKLGTTPEVLQPHLNEAIATSVVKAAGEDHRGKTVFMTTRAIGIQMRGRRAA